MSKQKLMNLVSAYLSAYSEQDAEGCANVLAPVISTSSNLLLYSPLRFQQK